MQALTVVAILLIIGSAVFAGFLVIPSDSVLVKATVLTRIVHSFLTRNKLVVIIITAVGFLSGVITIYNSVIAPYIADLTPTVITIEPEEWELLKDGTYYLPISITNDGNQSIKGDLSIFQQNTFLDRPTSSEEDLFMENIEMQAQLAGINTSNIQGPGSDLVPGQSVSLRETNLKFTNKQIQQIKGARLFPLYGVIVIYIGTDAQGKNILYYDEWCAYYDGNLSDYVNCQGHNFQNGIWQ